MITSPQIERAALMGKCFWRTFNTGYLSTYTIPVPKGGFILLRQIICYPFITNETRTNTSRFLHQLSMVEQGGFDELLYVIRSRHTEVGLSETSLAEIPGEPIQLETWATFKKNVVIDLCMIAHPSAAIYAAADTLAASAEERGEGLGYGATTLIPGGILNTPEIQLDATSTLYPTGEQRPYSTTAYHGTTVQDRLRFKMDANTNIPPVSNVPARSAYQMPLYTFGYWEFKTPITEALF